MFADLHLHSRFSDGLCTPRRLVEQAVSAGYAALAVTDHDTLDGIPETLAAGAELGIEVIPGVELTCQAQGRELHLLGYFSPQGWRDPSLAGLMAQAKRQRQQRITEIVHRLNQLGVALDPAEVESISAVGVLGRPHVALALQARGVVRNVEEAFERFLKAGRPAYVERTRVAVAEAIGHIRRAGGVAVLAHPGLQRIPADLTELTAQGLGGIEVWHSQHRPGQVTKYARWAADQNLVATGGSDAHGDFPGTIKMPYEHVQELKRRMQTTT